MKFCVIGLGRFGYQVATVLAEHGMEVLAIDSDESIVASIRDSVTQSICLRIKDEVSLQTVGVEEFETVIVATGENFAQSILLTALLKKRLNIKRVIARAINDIHKDILKLVGADQIILPEREIGIRLADNLSSPFTDLFRLTDDFVVSQIIAPTPFIGKTIAELELYQTHNAYCIGVKKGDEIKSIGSDYVVQTKDRLIFAGTNNDLERIAKLR